MTGENGTEPINHGVMGFYRPCPKCKDYINWRINKSWKGVAPFSFSELNRFYGFCYTCDHRLIVRYIGKPGTAQRYRSTNDYEIAIVGRASDIDKAG